MHVACFPSDINVLLDLTKTPFIFLSRGAYLLVASY